MQYLIFWAVFIITGSFGAESTPESQSTLQKRIEEASAAEARGDMDTAFKIYTKTAAENPNAAEAWAALGEHLRFYTHDGEAATVAFNKALSAQQHDATAIAFAWRGLGELAAKEGRDDLATACFKNSLEALPLADTHRSLCHLYCRQRKFKEAAAEAFEAVKLNAGDPIARLLYAAQLHRAGEQDEGRRQFEKALTDAGMDANGQAAGPVHCCVIYNAAGYLGVCGKNDDALKMLQRFFETPNHRHLSRAEIESDADFESLKNLPAFRELLDKYSEAPSK